MGSGDIRGYSPKRSAGESWFWCVPPLQLSRLFASDRASGAPQERVSAELTLAAMRTRKRCSNRIQGGVAFREAEREGCRVRFEVRNVDMPVMLQCGSNVIVYERCSRRHGCVQVVAGSCVDFRAIVWADVFQQTVH